MCLIGLVDAGLCGRIEVHAHRSFVIGMDRNALQTQFPRSAIELRNFPQFQLPSLHSVLIKAGARNPIATTATTINGHSTTNQKEMFQSEFLGVGFLFMHFSQAFEDRHFRNREIRFGMLWRSGDLAYVPALLADNYRLFQRNRLIFARSTISSPRPLRTALRVKRVKPFICARLIVGGMESSCRWTKTSTRAGPSCFRA